MLYDFNWCLAATVLAMRKAQYTAIRQRFYAKHKKRLLEQQAMRRANRRRNADGSAIRANDCLNPKLKHEQRLKRKRDNWKAPHNVAKREACADERLAKRRERWASKYSAAYADKRKRYYAEHRDEIIAKAKAYAQAHPGRSARYSKIRRDNDMQFKMATALRNRLWALIGPIRKFESLTLKLKSADLVIHLERHCLPGMTWANHGNGPNKWHIDHIVPCASFDLTKPDQIRACFSLSNLRPLWAKDNIQKGSKLMRQTELPLTS